LGLAKVHWLAVVAHMMVELGVLKRMVMMMNSMTTKTMTTKKLLVLLVFYLKGDKHTLLMAVA